MKDIRVDFSGNGVHEAELAALHTRLIPEIERIQAAQKTNQKTNYDTPYGCLHCPADGQMIEQVKQVIADVKKSNPTTVVVVGIGGSNLGTLAIQQALLGMYVNQKQSMKIYYADTVDSDHIHDILELVHQELRSKRSVIINIVSKSGKTTETIANGELFIELLRRYYGTDYYRSIVVTTDKDSLLWKLAQQKQYICLEIPQVVGGRYSVFSPVGLFPLGLLGIDIESLCAGARSVNERCTTTSFARNPAAHSAATLFLQYAQQKTIHDTFVFAVALHGVGAWYRQLMGESIGKEHDVKGNRVQRGMTPTVSVGSTDLHSVGQLYLGGPHDKVTTFITVEHEHASCRVPDYKEFDVLVPHIQGVSLPRIMEAIIAGTQRAYAQRSLPYITITLPEIAPWYLGQLMQIKMYEMIYLAFLLEVNPFDQPNVESYKQETRKILAHE